MEEKVVKILNEMSEYLSITQMKKLQEVLTVREEVVPLILPDGEEVSAVRFEALLYGIELTYLLGKKYTRARKDLQKRVMGVSKMANIPEINAQAEFINKIINTDYVERAGINEFEEIRTKLRDLMKYIKKENIRYDTDFADLFCQSDSGICCT